MIRHLLAIAFLASITTSAKLPKSWKTCKKNDSQLNQCLKTAIQDALGDLSKGVPSLGVLPLDPLHLIKLELNQGQSNSPVSINLTFNDIDFLGFSNAVIQNVQADWDKGRLKADIITPPPVNLIGDYAINGKILLLPVTGQGKCNITLINSFMSMLIKGSTVQKGSHKYFHTDQMDLDLKQDRVYMHFGNLFNGDKTLGENMNKVLNDNWEEVFKSFKETVSQGLSEAFKEISNRVFDKIPLDQIAPN